jgi:predicted transposase/invertase (TIGR01784 family)
MHGGGKSVKISRNEKERARLVSEYKYIVDTQSKMVEAERTGIRKGLRKGRQEGLLKGMQEGVLKGKLEVARSLRVSGIPLDKIASATGLSLDEIAAL